MSAISNEPPHLFEIFRIDMDDLPPSKPSQKENAPKKDVFDWGNRYVKQITKTEQRTVFHYQSINSTPPNTPLK
jgi:hypothetical protein